MSNEKEEVTTQCSAGLNISGVRHDFQDVRITDSPDFESQALHLLLVRLALLLTAEDENCIISTICPFLWYPLLLFFCLLSSPHISISFISTCCCWRSPRQGPDHPRPPPAGNTCPDSPGGRKSESEDDEKVKVIRKRMDISPDELKIWQTVVRFASAHTAQSWHSAVCRAPTSLSQKYYEDDLDVLQGGWWCCDEYGNVDYSPVWPNSNNFTICATWLLERKICSWCSCWTRCPTGWSLAPCGRGQRTWKWYFSLHLSYYDRCQPFPYLSGWRTVQASGPSLAMWARTPAAL